ncbi:FeoA family protein [Aphanothece sacrum]|uniref:FeoA family protein n=1 Tax=Aphanothece sacrum FPU1 TaxID=1920663 RepID=A0A401ICZ2_APHSA|nr:FeoA family protein [Aphanothece sacrum]GBF79040.1 FeoA family protein [Aphanothece sacrum FPU1]GBF86081.1 FeoA family protein [Aphanothece sacrum FPU3]
MFTQTFTVESSALNLLKEKEKGIITQFRKNDELLLKKLIAMGIMPGLSVTIEQRFPSFVINMNGTRLAIDRNLARAIYVRRTR